MSNETSRYDSSNEAGPSLRNAISRPTEAVHLPSMEKSLRSVHSEIDVLKAKIERTMSSGEITLHYVRNLTDTIRHLKIETDRKALVDLKVMAFDFFNETGFAFATWLLVEEETKCGRTIVAFEQEKEYFIQRSDQSLGFCTLQASTADEKWSTWISAISDKLGPHAFRARTSKVVWSHRRDVTAAGLTCGCFPSLTTPMDSHDQGPFCMTRRLAQKALLEIRHQIQFQKLTDIWSLKGF